MENSKTDLRLDAVAVGSILKRDYFYLLRSFDFQVVCGLGPLCETKSDHVCETADIFISRTIRWNISGKK